MFVLCVIWQFSEWRAIALELSALTERWSHREYDDLVDMDDKSSADDHGNHDEVQPDSYTVLHG